MGDEGHEGTTFSFAAMQTDIESLRKKQKLQAARLEQFIADTKAAIKQLVAQGERMVTASNGQHNKMVEIANAVNALTKIEKEREKPQILVPGQFKVHMKGK